MKVCRATSLYVIANGQWRGFPRLTRITLITGLCTMIKERHHLAITPLVQEELGQLLHHVYILQFSVGAPQVH